MTNQFSRFAAILGLTLMGLLLSNGSSWAECSGLGCLFSPPQYTVDAEQAAPRPPRSVPQNSLGPKSTIIFGGQQIDETSDEKMLGFIMNAEDGENGVKGMTAVGKVVMNRRDQEYMGAETVAQVVKSYAQFSPMWEGHKGAKVVSVNESQRLVRLAQWVMKNYKKIYPELDNVTHFYADWMDPPSWARSGELVHVNHIGGHYFLLPANAEPNLLQLKWIAAHRKPNQWPRQWVARIKTAAQTEVAANEAQPSPPLTEALAYAPAVPLPRQRPVVQELVAKAEAASKPVAAVAPASSPAPAAPAAPAFAPWGDEAAELLATNLKQKEAYAQMKAREAQNDAAPAAPKDPRLSLR